MIYVVNKKNHTPTENDFYIGRGSSLGNIYTHIPNIRDTTQVRTREEAISLFSQWLRIKLEQGDQQVRAAMNQIYIMAKKGDVNLVCYCSPDGCHGEIIKHKIEALL